LRQSFTDSLQYIIKKQGTMKNGDYDNDYIDQDDDYDDDDYLSGMKIAINSKDIDQNVISQDNLIQMKRQFPDLDYDTLGR